MYLNETRKKIYIIGPNRHLLIINELNSFTEIGSKHINLK